ncbi:hormone-sensitive lipase isoform X2 [Lepisosteus oculatus]|uniref:hormone-sensitive lipase isoform X2 n=1 Tax=Lepisosteus oculatus TaxID=7918 RepID=UPI00371896FB
MATGKEAGSGPQNGVRLSPADPAPAPLSPAATMDSRAVFSALYDVCQENVQFFSAQPGGGASGEAARRFVEAFSQIQGHAHSLEPVMGGFSALCHVFDFDPQTPANGYRSLIKVVRSCLLHIVHKGRYIAANRRSIFFRANHNAAEMEAYCSALCQLRALLYLAQRLLAENRHGNLFFAEESGLSEQFVREYSSMHKGCFYGRCLGFQFTPAIRPFLQTISIGLVSFGENYRRHQSGIVEGGGITQYGVAASSFFTSGKYAIDPELRGAEFERITQNLDVQFWKTFWNITETEVLSSLASMTSTTVRVNRTLSVPPDPFDIPLASDPRLMVTITPPVAHCGPAPVQMRLLSYELREGQDSAELLSLCRSEGPSLSLGLKSRPSPCSPCLIVHYHGGGFVAQTSKSHEPYLKSWTQALGVPILSVDYSLAPEAPFPRALEECFYAYCWALKNCHLLGWTGERVCLAGDSAGGNLCLTVSMRAASFGVRPPDGIMAAYPATLLTATASPSRLLTLIDPLLPLSVLSKCLSAYAGTEPQADRQLEKLSALSMVRRDTALLLRDFRQGASNWIHSLLDTRRSADSVRKSVSEASLGSPHSDPPVPPVPPTSFSVKSKTCQDLGTHRHNSPATSTAPPDSLHKPEDVSFFLTEDDSVESSVGGGLSEGVPSPPVLDVPSPESAPFSGPCGPSSEPPSAAPDFPEGFTPLRSEQLAEMRLQTSPIVRNPYMSPLLAPDSMLRGLPPLHIVACALDPMLDDSVMFAKRLRAVNQPVTLCVVEDLPHGFLSLSQLSRETREAASICVERIREIFRQEAPPRIPPPLQQATIRKHRKLERTNHTPSPTPEVRTGGTKPEWTNRGPASSQGGGASSTEGEGLTAGVAQSSSDCREIGA